MDQVNINPGPDNSDPLLQYRMGKAEEAIKILSDGFADIAATVRGARWALLAIFGIIQPVVIALAVHYLTKGN